MPKTEELVTARLQDVRSRIRAACERVGRRPNEVQLVAVTKTVSSDTLRALDSTDITDIGENRVQDALAKIAELEQQWPGFSTPGKRRFRLHMIGHVQTNKVRKVLPVFDVIHSLDSLRLAEAISVEAQRLGIVARTLVQVNASGETSKFGLAQAELGSFLTAARRLSCLAIEGLMTMAPEDADPEKARPVFRRLRELLEQHRAGGALPPEAGTLSMGMTQDFEVAIEEGATMIRVGSAIFGKARNSKLEIRNKSEA